MKFEPFNPESSTPNKYPMPESFKVEKAPDTFSGLDMITKEFPKIKEHPLFLETISKSIFDIVSKYMPYDNKYLSAKHEDTYLGQSDESRSLPKVSLTNYLTIHTNGEAVSVCRHQGLMAALVAEKLFDKMDYKKYRPILSSDYNTSGSGHAWCTLVNEQSSGYKKDFYVIDVAQKFTGLITEKDYDNPNPKIWPYHSFFNNNARSYTGIAARLDNEGRHFITRDTKIDKGYKAFLGEHKEKVFLVVDWDKYYNSGYSLIEKEVSEKIKKDLKPLIEELTRSQELQNFNYPGEILGCKNVDDLLEIIKKGGPIQGSKQLYSVDDLIFEIKEAIETGDSQYLTNTFGLADKVDEFILISRKYKVN